MEESIRSQAISCVKWSAVSKIYMTLVSVSQVAILARYLEKEDFGLMGIAVLVNTFCGIFVDMGLSAAAMHEQDLSKHQFSSFYWFNLFSGFVLFIIISACSPIIAAYYHREELVGVISLTSMSIFILSISSLQRTMQQKQMNFRFMSIVDIISATAALLLNVFLAISGYGVYSLVWAQLLSGILTALAYLGIAIIKERNILFHFSIIEIKNALKIGIYQVGTASLDFISREMDSFIISSNMPMEVFGVYTLCKNITMRIYHVINPIVTNVLTPIFAKIQGEKDRLSEAYIRTVEILGYVNFPIYGVVAVGSFSIMSILYGDSYNAYAFVMSSLAIYYAFQSCGNPIGSLLIATGRTDRGFYWTIFRIIFMSLYLKIASVFSLNVFVICIAITPIITSYPCWFIILKKISTIRFYDAFILPMKPFFICLLLSPISFLDNAIESPVVSVSIVSFFFLTGYYMLNNLFRPILQDYMLKNMLRAMVRGETEDV